MATANNTDTANRVASYVIVFTVDLTRTNSVSFPSANENQTSGTIALQRTTFIPSFSGGSQNMQVRHGDVFTAYDEDAYYLKAHYVKSASNPYGILTITTETP